MPPCFRFWTRLLEASVNFCRGSSPRPETARSVVVERILSLAVSVSRSPWRGGVPGVSPGPWWRAEGGSGVTGVPNRSF